MHSWVQRLLTTATTAALLLLAACCAASALDAFHVPSVQAQAHVRIRLFFFFFLLPLHYHAWNHPRLGTLEIGDLLCIAQHVDMAEIVLKCLGICSSRLS